jgi:hypothetical protein
VLDYWLPAPGPQGFVPGTTYHFVIPSLAKDLGANTVRSAAFSFHLQNTTPLAPGAVAIPDSSSVVPIVAVP